MNQKTTIQNHSADAVIVLHSNNTNKLVKQDNIKFKRSNLNLKKIFLSKFDNYNHENINDVIHVRILLTVIKMHVLFFLSKYYHVVANHSLSSSILRGLVDVLSKA